MLVSFRATKSWLPFLNKITTHETRNYKLYLFNKNRNFYIMKSHNNPFMWYIMATLICFLLFLETTSNEIGLEQAIEQQLNSEQINSEEIYEKTLNRKRRYLEFPEGSSFQLGKI